MQYMIVGRQLGLIDAHVSCGTYWARTILQYRIFVRVVLWGNFPLLGVV